MDTIPVTKPRRKICGMSAILLPMLNSSEVDWQGFRDHLLRTAGAGIIPALNMDTGYGNLISEAERERVLSEAKSLLGGKEFIAGAFVGDKAGEPFNFDLYRQRIDQIQSYGGTPIIFQSYGLTQQSDDAIVSSYERLGTHAGKFYGFELGKMFAPFGSIYSLDVYEALVRMPSCLGAKHSSLSRVQEWDRLKIRDRVRPEFRVLTGNDLAIDMVMYGSDYLLGLSTFAPEEFARRDQMWEAGDPQFYELNDWLQYLGFFAFRSPVPAYKHNAAQFLHARGWIKTPLTYPGSPTRPDSDVPILRDILDHLRSYH